MRTWNYGNRQLGLKRTLGKNVSKGAASGAATHDDVVVSVIIDNYLVDERINSCLIFR